MIVQTSAGSKLSGVSADSLNRAAVTPSQSNGYNFSLGYLRAFITLLVVAHHSILAYISFSPPKPSSLTAQPRLWLAFPIVDSRKWAGFDFLAMFNDVFFMSLMFFLSGLFVWSSLQRKGDARFLQDRLRRLGLPFLLSVCLLAPLAYVPTYLASSSPSKGVSGFVQQWLSLGSWPAGPAWFVAMLLAFDCIAVGLPTIAPNWAPALGRKLACIASQPAKFFGFLACAAAIAYVPMALIFNPMVWTVFGPVTFQTSRVFHYALYFLLAVSLGALGGKQGLLAPKGALARRWYVWIVVALGAFILNVAFGAVAMSSPTAAAMLKVPSYFGFVLSCAATCFAMLSLFLRFFKRRNNVFDSLNSNAYGIYLVHYIFVSWLQYLLLPASIPAVAKAAIVFAGTVLLSWAAITMIRRIPRIANIV